MIETVFSAALPVGERLIVKKNRIEGRGGRGPRIAVVTGIHGDGLEGQFVAFELAQRLRERIGDLRGIVDIYPALNPLGISASEHGVPLTRTLVVEMGESLRITEDAGSWLTEGILRLVEHLGGWTSSSVALPFPRLVRDSNVTSLSGRGAGSLLATDWSWAPRCVGTDHRCDCRPLGGGGEGARSWLLSEGTVISLAGAAAGLSRHVGRSRLGRCR